MRVAHWNLIQPNAKMSGLKRYDDEIYTQCSKYGVVDRYHSQGKKLDSFLNYKAADVTHITTQQVAFLRSFKNVKNCVVTVHDLIESHWYSKSRNFHELWYLNELLLSQVKNFIADSYYTKKDLMETFGIPEDHIDVIYLGVDHKTFFPMNREICRKALDFDEGKVYCFGVSSGEPWKNTEILKSLPFEIIDIGYGRGKFGYVDDNMLRALYCACDVFLAPSKAEGFGLPILEAQACGCPVVASNCTSFPEVTGQGGQLVDPDNKDQWVEAICKAVDHREKWGNRGIVNAKKFSWEHTGKQTWKVYEKIAE